MPLATGVQILTCIKRLNMLAHGFEFGGVEGAEGGLCCVIQHHLLLTSREELTFFYTDCGKHSSHSAPLAVTHRVIQLKHSVSCTFVNRTSLCKQSAQIACTLGSRHKMQLFGNLANNWPISPGSTGTGTESLAFFGPLASRVFYEHSKFTFYWWPADSSW